MDRRRFGMTALAAGLATGIVGGIVATAGHADAASDRIEPILGEDGMYHQPWFVNSFLDLKEDLAEAAEAGKRFVVMWEQRGCPYCRETHMVNFARPDISQYVQDNFAVLQLDLFGSRVVTDFDGETLEERALARKWGIVFTPTIMFFADSVAEVEGKNGAQAEVARMPGYFKPFHFVTMFEYVKESAYERQHFQKFLQAKGDRLRAQGVEVNLW
ncbi:MAG: thioredoxin family protein [Alphaproteobacteria bacterium]|nr:thioredoxin family protein [Alphaproteobacteria bacterium]